MNIDKTTLIYIDGNINLDKILTQIYQSEKSRGIGSIVGFE